MFCTDELQDARREEGRGKQPIDFTLRVSGAATRRGRERRREHPDYTTTPTDPAGLGRSFIDRAGWFAEQVSGLENGPFSRHIGSRRRERERKRERRGPEARTALEMMGKEELNMISA